MSGLRQAKPAATAVGSIGLDHQQLSTFQWLERSREGGPIQAEQVGDGRHRRRLGTVQSHQERELLVRQSCRAQDLVEPTRERPRRTLRVQAKAAVPDLLGCFERNRL